MPEYPRLLSPIVSPSCKNNLKSCLFSENTPEYSSIFDPFFRRPPMVFTWPIATMTSQSRLTIKTHAVFQDRKFEAYKELFCHITLNYQGSGFGSNRGVLRGFPGSKKEQTEPEPGLFYPWESSIPDRIPGIWCQTVSSDSYLHQGMKVSAQSTDTCSLEIENLEGARQREKNFTIFPWSGYIKKLFFSRVEAKKKTKTGSPIVFQTRYHRCVKGSCTSHVFFVSAISLSIQSWTRSFISW